MNRDAGSCLKIDLLSNICVKWRLFLSPSAIGVDSLRKRGPFSLLLEHATIVIGAAWPETLSDIPFYAKTCFSFSNGKIVAGHDLNRPAVIRAMRDTAILDAQSLDIGPDPGEAQALYMDTIKCICVGGKEKKACSILRHDAENADAGMKKGREE